MDNHPMTPQAIAREAAEAIFSRFITAETDERVAQYQSEIAALILSAAAKMVQESGAVEALRASNIVMAGMLGHIPKESPSLESAEMQFAFNDAALAKLRAIGEPRQGDS